MVKVMDNIVSTIVQDYLLSPVPLTVLGVTLVIWVGIIILYKHFFSYWKKRGLNYLEPTVPFGNAINLYLGKSSFGELFSEWYLEMKKRGWKHGGAYFFGKPVYMPIDNELVKKVLVSDFINFPNHGFFIDEKKDPLSGHIFNMENYKWKNLRAKLPVAFTAAKMRTNVVVMEKTSRILIEKLEEYARNKNPVEIKDVLSRYGTDISTACNFGMESHTLDHKNETLLKEGRAFFDVQWSRVNNTLMILIPRHVLSMLGFGLYTNSATKYFMKMFKEIKEYREKNAFKRNDLTDLLMNLCDKTKRHTDFNGQGEMEPLTFEEFAAQMFIFFETGFETSSSTQTFAIYELGANPDVQDKLRKEINTVLARHDGKITYDSVNEMEYLDRILDETLRKYPIFPVLPRVCIKDYKVPETDFTVTAGTFVMVTQFGIHYDPEYYPDPMKFDPDRFLPENKAKRPYCSYMPFGEGPRICIGKRFGIWQIKIGLVSIVKNYKITLSKKMKLPFSFDKAGTILKTKGDVWLDLEKL